MLHQTKLIVSLLIALLVFVPACAAQQDADAGRPRVRTILGGEYWIGDITADRDAYLAYLAAVKPDVAHGGVVGPELASSIDAQGTRKAITEISPRPIDSIKAHHAWWKAFNDEAHKSGIKVQATFSLTNAWGDEATNVGWFKYYNDLWETDLLGPKPVADVRELMETDGKGNLLHDGNRYRGSVNNPHWREVLKRFVKAGIEAGFDGFMVQYPHARGPSADPYAQAQFREFLSKRYNADVLRQKFGIEDIDNYVFDTTGPGDQMNRPIDIEARQFAAESVKACFDEVFIEYGRSLKPDLVVSIWAHHRNFLSADVLFQKEMTNTDFAQMVDERMLLPIERWGKGEDYVWYSTPTYKTDLPNKLLGDAAMEHRLLRAVGDGMAFEILKYDYHRWRLVFAESVSNGGIVFGAWRGGWSGGTDREDPHFKTYFEFIRKHSDTLFPRTEAGEVAVLYPRTALHHGDATYLTPLRQMGRALLDDHVLWDMVLDQRMTGEQLAKYHAVLVPEVDYLSDAQLRELDAYIAQGGIVIRQPGPRRAKDAPPLDERGWSLYWGDLAEGPAFAEFVRALVKNKSEIDLSAFKAEYTVQTNIHAQPDKNRLIVHYCNYNRDESQSGKELPIAAAPIASSVLLPEGAKVKKATFLTPERDGVMDLTVKQDGRNVSYTTPYFVTYGAVVLEVE